MERLSRRVGWPGCGYDKFGPVRPFVVDVVLGATRRGSARGLVGPCALSGLFFGMSLELRSSSGQGRFHVFAKVRMMRKLRAPK